MKVGFIGLGIMGAPMALNLLKAGHQLFATTRGKVPDAIAASSATVCADARQVTQQADVVFLMVPDTPDVEAVLFGEAGVATQPDGRKGALLRAYDKATGADRGAVYMPAPQTGSPMTYMQGGQQYVVLAIGGGNYTAELIAFRLKKA